MLGDKVGDLECREAIQHVVHHRTLAELAVCVAYELDVEFRDVL